MLYYTIMPPDTLEWEDDDVGEWLEVVQAGVTMLVQPTAPGRGVIQRLISSDPAHFLDPALAPGQEVPLDAVAMGGGACNSDKEWTEGE